MTDFEQARIRAEAEAVFKRKENGVVQGTKATEGYKAELRALREKTARLRTLRLARDQTIHRT